jgi:hypothetical protein
MYKDCRNLLGGIACMRQSICCPAENTPGFQLFGRFLDKDWWDLQ